MIMSVAVASLTIKNGLGKCLAYQRGQQTSGQFVITKMCNSSDAFQTNWIVDNSTSSGGSPTLQWCVNGTSLCVGIERSSIPYIRRRLLNIDMKMVANDPSDESQLFIPLDTAALPNHYINALTGQCAQSLTVFNQSAGITTPLRCTDNKAQQWTII